VGAGPTKVFSASTSFTFTPTLPTAFFDATLTLKSFNSANVDRSGQNRAEIFYSEIFDVFTSNVDTAGGTGTVNVTLNAPFNFYDRLGRGETLVVKYDLRVLTTQNNTDGIAPVQITFKGRNDLPQAVNDKAVTPDGFSGFRMKPLGNDKEVDINDVFRITDAVRFGPVVAGPNTVLPPEFDPPPPAPGVGHDADEIILNIPRYYQFLTTGESMTFKVKYTMTDGEGGVSSAFVAVKIKGQKASTFVGTSSGDRMLGEKRQGHDERQRGQRHHPGPRRQ
jgi:hypothetical protein